MSPASPPTRIKRRTFLAAGAAGVASLSLGLSCLERDEREADTTETTSGQAPPGAAPVAYGDWRDVYR